MTTLSDTSLSLLERVKRGDGTAWSEFFRRCESMLRRWSGKMGLQAADADDLVQDTLLIVIGRIRFFQRRGTGSFRAWLRVISWRCWCDAVARIERTTRPQVLEQLKNLAQARISLEQELDRLFEQQLLEQAFETVKARAQENTWEAFRLMVLEGQRGEVVAAKTGMQLNAVYTARCRIQRMVTAEMQRLVEADRED
jgi:RNA polymerase sigma-70 factor (ECF subfamily)